jgi:hypothetical protein
MNNEIINENNNLESFLNVGNETNEILTDDLVEKENDIHLSIFCFNF